MPQELKHFTRPHAKRGPKEAYPWAEYFRPFPPGGGRRFVKGKDFITSVAVFQDTVRKAARRHGKVVELVTDATSVVLVNVADKAPGSPANASDRRKVSKAKRTAKARSNAKV